MPTRLKLVTILTLLIAPALNAQTPPEQPNAAPSQDILKAKNANKSKAPKSAKSKEKAALHAQKKAKHEISVVSRVTGFQDLDSSGKLYFELTFTPVSGGPGVTEFFSMNEADQQMTPIKALPPGVKQVATVEGEEYSDGRFEVWATDKQTGEKTHIEEDVSRPATPAAPAGNAPAAATPATPATDASATHAETPAPAAETPAPAAETPAPAAETPAPAAETPAPAAETPAPH